MGYLAIGFVRDLLQSMCDICVSYHGLNGDFVFNLLFLFVYLYDGLLFLIAVSINGLAEKTGCRILNLSAGSRHGTGKTQG